MNSSIIYFADITSGSACDISVLLIKKRSYNNILILSPSPTSPRTCRLHSYPHNFMVFVLSLKSVCPLLFYLYSQSFCHYFFLSIHKFVAIVCHSFRLRVYQVNRNLHGLQMIIIASKMKEI